MNNKLLMIIKLSIVGLMFSGCVTMNTEEHFRRFGLERASFDMDCPKDQIQVRVLSELNTGNGQVGVTGCNKKAAYVAAQGAGWVNNSAVPVKR
ncbi:hypothetical protein EHO59_17365 [Leptospira semungkisensis]|uniref:Lipoprotein n=1 Tax=Leptospira semungkisensis TaxID=2484985 RepID=A0A4R9FLR8_9LEPT|nr:hypothetical protein [Leptospira semungkisensis]TGJ99611.1 hypothetical protein EHO59_17365 [Leptospira semungkisensis]